MYILKDNQGHMRHISEPIKMANFNYTLKTYILKDKQEHIRYISEHIKTANFNYTLKIHTVIFGSHCSSIKSNFLKKFVKYELKEKKAMKSRNSK